MTEVQKQRLIGAVLLLCIISGIAIFLLVHVSKTNPPEKPATVSFKSVVKPLNGNQVEVIKKPSQEALLDPHHLGKAAGPGLQPTINKNEQKQIVKKDTAHVKSKTPAPEKAKVPAPAKVAVATEKTDSHASSPDQWVIQLASFSVETNANALKKQLQQMGYQAVIDKTAFDKGTLYRVQLAPMPDKTKVDKIAAELNKKLALHAQVFKHAP